MFILVLFGFWEIVFGGIETNLTQIYHKYLAAGSLGEAWSLVES